MAEALQFEALPQRAPKGKRKRRKESVADDKPAKGQNGSLAPPPAAGPEAAAESAELASSTAPDSSKAGGKEPSMPQKPDAAEPPISEEAQEYRAAAEPGQKFECELACHFIRTGRCQLSSCCRCRFKKQEVAPMLFNVDYTCSKALSHCRFRPHSRRPAACM